MSAGPEVNPKHVDAYQWQDIGWAVLNGMGELVVEKTDMAQVDFKEIEFDQEIRAQLVSEPYFSIDAVEHTRGSCL